MPTVSSDAKQQLVHYLEKNAFEPILRADPERLRDDNRRHLESVQRFAAADIERFENIASAEAVVRHFEEELPLAQAWQRELNGLGLPTIADVPIRDGFYKLVARLGVGRAEARR